MTAKKQKQKDRRRARKLADEAWQAVEDGRLHLAEKLIRRATATLAENPRLWNDQGLILLRTADEREADQAFRNAIRIAPDYAEPYHHLAALRARQERLDEAVGLEASAARLDPKHPRYAGQLAEYRALAGRQQPAPPPRPPGAAEDRPA